MYGKGGTVVYSTNLFQLERLHIGWWCCHTNFLSATPIIFPPHPFPPFWVWCRELHTPKFRSPTYSTLHTDNARRQSAAF